MSDQLAVRTLEKILETSNTMLSVRHGGKVATPSIPIALATISAGRKVKGNTGDRPMKSKAGEWFIHNSDGMGYGLIESFGAIPADKAFPDVYQVNPVDGKPVPLTVAFPSDNPDEVFRTYFIKRTAQRVDIFGDETKLTQFIVKDPQKRTFDVREYLAGSDEYKKLIQECKVECFAYFALADWGWDSETQKLNPQTIYPDGLGVYRLRFTSVNAHKNFKAMLRQIATITGGKLAGVPLELFLQKRQLTQPGGWQGTEWIWTPRFNPPQPDGKAMRLSLPQLRGLALEGAKGGGILALPSPEDDREVIEGEISEIEVANIQTGFNPESIRDEFFARVQDSPYAEDVPRAWLLGHLTGGTFTSLAKLLEERNDYAAYDGFLLEVESAVARWKVLRAKISDSVERVAKLYKLEIELVWAEVYEETGLEADTFEIPVLEQALTHLNKREQAKAPVSAEALQKLL